MKIIAFLVIAATLALQAGARANPSAAAVGKWLVQQIAADWFSDRYDSAPRDIQARLDAAEGAFTRDGYDLAANDAALAYYFRQAADEIYELRQEVKPSRERIEEVVNGVLGKLEKRIGAAEARLAGVDFRARIRGLPIAFKLSSVTDWEMVPSFRKLADAGVAIESRSVAATEALPNKLAAHAAEAAKLADTRNALARSVGEVEGDLARAVSVLPPEHPDALALQARKNRLLGEAAALQAAADGFLDRALADFEETVRSMLRPTAPVMEAFHSGSILPVARIAALCAGAGADNATLREDCWKRLLAEGALARGAVGEAREFEVGDGVKLVMKYVPAGTFVMGSPAEQKDRYPNEKPHEVILTSHCWMGETEVTQAQWEAVMGGNPSGFKGDHLPVENVSWVDADALVKALNLKAPLPGGWRWMLPSDAQWERACRGGTDTAFHCGDSLSSTQANFDGKYPYGGATEGPSLQQTAPVKSYLPNAYGLYDMHGNVWEWCSDRYLRNLAGTATDPDSRTWGTSGRVVRGGSWLYPACDCRAAIRDRFVPGVRNYDLGIRLAAGPAER